MTETRHVDFLNCRPYYFVRVRQKYWKEKWSNIKFSAIARKAEEAVNEGFWGPFKTLLCFFCFIDDRWTQAVANTWRQLKVTPRNRSNGRSLEFHYRLQNMICGYFSLKCQVLRNSNCLNILERDSSNTKRSIKTDPPSFWGVFLNVLLTRPGDRINCESTYDSSS